VRETKERVQDVLEAIERIERRVGMGWPTFESDEMLQVWVLHHLQIIGEACRAMPEGFRTQHPKVPWPRIIGMRHILVHHYFDIDTRLVWSTVVDDLPPLKSAVIDILRE